MLLCKITKLFASIIECKKTDGVRQAQKQETRRKIQNMYNANTKGVPRTIDNLLSCYRNMKSKIKKQHSHAKMVLEDPIKKNSLISAIVENGKNWSTIATRVNEPADICKSGFIVLTKELKKKESQHKKAIMGTGGGPPSLCINDSEPLSQLKKIIEPQIDGLYTIYDGDSELMSKYQESLPENERIKPIEHDILEEWKETPSCSTSSAYRSPLLDKGLPKIASKVIVLSNSSPSTVSNLTQVKDPASRGTSRTTCQTQLPYTSIVSTPDIEFETNDGGIQQMEENDIEISINSTPIRSNRVDLLRKRKASPLCSMTENKKIQKKEGTNEAFKFLAEQKLELVRMQKLVLEKELVIKEMEVEEKRKEYKHREIVREKELLLLDMKINNLK